MEFHSAASTFLEPRLGEDLVTLIVGKEKKKMVVHKKLLCKSADFFEAAFEGSFSEAKEGVMNLPDDNVGAVSLFIDWIYRSSLPHGCTKSYLENLYRPWIFATKICLPKLADETIDRIQHTCDRFDQFIEGKLLREVYEKTGADAPLRRFAMDLRIHELWINKKDVEEKHANKMVGKYCLATEEELNDWFAAAKDMKERAAFEASFIYRLLMRIQNSASLDPRNIAGWCINSCAYHSHDEAGKVRCAARKRMVWDSKA